MAVKQNNTEANDNTGAVGGGNANGGGNTANGAGISNAGVVSGVAKKKNLAHDGGGGGGSAGSLGGNGIIEKQDNSGNNMKSLNSMQNGLTNSAPYSDMDKILKIVEFCESQNKSLVFYERIICELSRIQVRVKTEERLRFKEDIAKVAVFLSEPNEKHMYIYYLNLVCQLITNDATDESPSYALAVVFQLFNHDMIIEAVQALLGKNVVNSRIRKTVATLCQWVPICTFYPNLNLWVLAILTGLAEQEKYMLLDDIAMDNIESLFQLMCAPMLRTKVSPIVVHMLSSICQTPDIFLKILPKIPALFLIMEQQIDTEDTRNCLQKLVDVFSALMDRFYDYDGLYDALRLTLKNFMPSYNYKSLVNGPYKNDDDEQQSNVLQNNTNARVGLVNLGNTCYMNSVLQALAMTKEFSREIMLLDSKSPLLLKIQEQIALMHYSTRFELTPTRVLNATRPPGFLPGLQQDSSEFLGYLLDTLHEQEVAYSAKSPDTVDSAVTRHENRPTATVTSATVTSIAENDALIINENAPNGIIPYGSYGNQMTSNYSSPIKTAPNTPTKVISTNIEEQQQHQQLQQQHQEPAAFGVQSTIEKTFNGRLGTIYKCLSCGWQSRNVDSFRDLQLSFPEVKHDCSASNYSVQDLIDYYCSPEKLDGDNQYFCERCKKLCDAERYINVISAPKNLILTLKHFKYDQKFHMRAKLMHKVFHDEKVTVKVCDKDSLEEVATVHYDLYAGVVHSGYSMDSGHYYTYAADEKNTWYKFNDNVVSLAKSEELHNLTPPNTPYILFYQMSARSNEATNVLAESTKVIKVDIPLPLKLEDLPRPLHDYVVHDNCVFNEELRIRQYKEMASKKIAANARDISYRNNRRNNSSDDDDDDDSPPPTSNGCGGNALGMNINRFVY